ncbi:Nitroreductase [Durotheca rogersii]|uniref:Nitroreductase n=1 Tax=Durotheca rogersii TaxID=419775 RepID=UPI00221FB6E3|nr:Nitroreductase [Durotheca rogersii]KAI5865590.1 Nitroreductase [Durotheca rogersii]
MRPHFFTSAVWSLSRLSTTSATLTSSSSATALLRASSALRSLPLGTCNPQRLFVTSSHQCSAVKPQPRTAASNPTTMATKTGTIIDLIKLRRTIYGLNKELPISTDRVQEIVKDALRHIPSSFNSQSNRVLVVFGADHDKLWDITSDVLKAIVPAEQWESTAGRIASFKAGAGTVLFFEDQAVVKKMQTDFALYSDRFPVWASQTDAMLQFTIWTALSAEGVGANLQHYNPLIDAKVANEWGIPETWQLNAQLVFGGKTGEAGEKDFKPLEEIYKIAGV